MGDGGHDCDLTAGSEDSCADAIKDLTHDEQANMRVGCTEWDQECSAQDDERNAGISNVLEVSPATDGVAYKRRDEGRSEREGIKNITGGGDGEIMDHL